LSDLGSDLRKNSVVILDDGVVQGVVNRIDFTGGTVTVAGVTATVPLGGGGGGATITVQDEGVTQSTTVTTLNFTGAGVTASGSGAVATINVPSGGGGVPTSRTISTAAPLSGGGDLSADRTITTSMNTNRLIGRGTAGSGVMEEITLGANLSLSGTTLNATGGGGSAVWTELDVDFGAKPVYDAQFTITDAGISASSKVVVMPSGKASTGRTADDWRWDGAVFAANPASGSATCYATFLPGPIVGFRKLQYQVSA
jgi:hypothetical protein